MDDRVSLLRGWGLVRVGRVRAKLREGTACAVLSPSIDTLPTPKHTTPPNTPNIYNVRVCVHVHVHVFSPSVCMNKRPHHFKKKKKKKKNAPRVLHQLGVLPRVHHQPQDPLGVAHRGAPEEEVADVHGRLPGVLQVVPEDAVEVVDARVGQLALDRAAPPVRGGGGVGVCVSFFCLNITSPQYMSSLVCMHACIRTDQPTITPHRCMPTTTHAF